MSNMSIRVLTHHDWPQYKQLRLRALKESPEAFDATLESELRFSDTEWRSRLDPSHRKTHALPLIAEFDCAPTGLVWGAVDVLNPNTASVYQMWVANVARGKGVGRALLYTVIAWARELQLEQLMLSVNKNNSAALSLYESVGFQPVFATSPVLAKGVQSLRFNVWR